MNVTLISPTSQPLHHHHHEGSLTSAASWKKARCWQCTWCTARVQSGRFLKYWKEIENISSKYQKKNCSASSARRQPNQVLNWGVHCHCLPDILELAWNSSFATKEFDVYMKTCAGGKRRLGTCLMSGAAVKLFGDGGYLVCVIQRETSTGSIREGVK